MLFRSDVARRPDGAPLVHASAVRASFVPPAPIRALRDLTRTRHQLTRQVTQNENRIAKVLEDANIKLATVVSDLLGVTSRRILAAMIAGETNPGRLAALADRRIKASPAELAAAHHAFLVGEHLGMIDHLAERIARFEKEMEALLATFRATVEHLRQIPGVKTVSAHAIIAEIGLGMSRFPTAGHLLSWARRVPRLDETGGRKRSTRVKQGGAWLKPLLVQCAWAAVRSKGRYGLEQQQMNRTQQTDVGWAEAR